MANLHLGTAGSGGKWLHHKSHRAPEWERMGRQENIHGNMLLQTGRNDVPYMLETTVYIYIDCILYLGTV